MAIKNKLESMLEIQELTRQTIIYTEIESINAERTTHKLEEKRATVLAEQAAEAEKDEAELKELTGKPKYEKEKEIRKKRKNFREMYLQAFDEQLKRTQVAYINKKVELENGIVSLLILDQMIEEAKAVPESSEKAQPVEVKIEK